MEKAQIQHGRTAAASESNTMTYLHSSLKCEYIMTFLKKSSRGSTARTIQCVW